MVRAGRLRKRVIVQELTDGKGARGGLTKTWATFVQRWANETPLKGQERFLAQQAQATANTRFTLRHTAGLTAKMRLLVPQVATSLNGGINATVPSVTVVSAAGFAKSGNYRIRVGSELMEVTGGQGTTSWTVTRGVDGTTAAAHGDGATVRHMTVHDIESIVNVDGRNREVELLVSEAK